MALGRNLNALLDSGWVVASPDINARRDRQPRPSSLPPVIRSAMLGKIGPKRDPLSLSAKVVGKSVSVEVAGGVQPFTVTVLGSAQTKSSRTFAFTVDSVGEHEATVEDGAQDTASARFTIIVSEPAKKQPRKAE